MGAWFRNLVSARSLEWVIPPLSETRFLAAILLLLQGVLPMAQLLRSPVVSCGGGSSTGGSAFGISPSNLLALRGRGGRFGPVDRRGRSPPCPAPP